MAPRKEVPSLQDLCLQSVQSHVTKLILNYAKNNHQQVPIEDSELNATIETDVYGRLPPNTHDRFVELRLLQLEKIFAPEQMLGYLCELFHDELLGHGSEYLEEVLLSGNVQDIFKFIKLIKPDNKGHARSSQHKEVAPKEVALFKYLMSPVSHLSVKAISMGDRLSSNRHETPVSVFRHPEESVVDLVPVVLLRQTQRLKVFSVHQMFFYSVIGWRSKLTHNVRALKDLTSFTLHACSDEILAAVSESCKSIRVIDVRSAKHVSDNCIEHLTKCQELESVTLDGTGVSAKGYFKLLTRSKSSELRYVSGLHNHVNEILDLMESSPVCFSPSQLRQLSYSKVEANHLNLISRYFPHLVQLSLEFNSITDPDRFSFVSVFRIRPLKEVALQFSCEDFHKVRRVISKCPLVTSLTLHQGSEPNALNSNSSLLSTIALCPNLEKLTIKQPAMTVAIFDPLVQLVTNPFQNLKALVWVDAMTVPFAQYILCHAHSIESFEFTSHPSYQCPRIADRFFECIFKQNPLTELRYLSLRYGHNLSMEMLKRIISSCEKLKFLRINIPRSEKEALLTFISEHNYDLVLQIDTDCTWFR